MLKIAEMSSTELLFVQMYVRALKRDYDMVQTVMELMHPEKTAVSSIVTATKLACGLERIADDFAAQMHAVDEKHKFRHTKPLPWPPLDDLADLFSLSFFKVLTKTNGTKSKDAGWFSGEPDNWAIILDEPMSGMHQNMVSNLPDAFFTDLTKAAKKLFGISFFSEVFGQFKKPKNNWPVPDDDYDDQYEDDDDYE